MIAMKFILTMSMLLLMVTQSQSVPDFYPFKRNQQMGGKKCNDADVVYRDMPLSLARCAGMCNINDRCAGFMYNPLMSSCVGCQGLYTNETSLVSDPDAQYFQDNHWLGFGGNLYKLIKTAVTFDDAVKYCTSINGFLAKVDSAGKLQFIADNFGSHYLAFWIGLTHQDVDGTWTWVSDGTAATYTNWDTDGGQPDGSGNCVRILEYIGYKWADRYCNNLEYPLCEKLG